MGELATVTPLLVHVVDDDPSVRKALGRQIRSLGLRSRTFDSGTALLADPDLAEASCSVVDLHMPGIGGYELARRLAEIEPASPVILITARGDELGRWERKAPSAVALLLKPFSETELIGTLEKALGATLE